MNPLRFSLGLSSFIFLTHSLFAQPLLGREGGGGGGLKIDDKIYSLAQAGLKLEDPATPYFPDDVIIQATEEALKKIEAKLPTASRFLLRRAIFNNDHIYQKVSVVDPELFGQLTLAYKKYVDSLKTTGTFILPAYTIGKVTYLLPDFFSASPDTQALYLIHEAAFYLIPNAQLHDVLGLEIAVLNLTRDPQSTEAAIELYDALFALTLITEQAHDALYLSSVTKPFEQLTLTAFVGRDFDLKRSERDGDYACGQAPVVNWYATDGTALKRSSRRYEETFFRRFYRTNIALTSVNVETRAIQTGYSIGCGLRNQDPNNLFVMFFEDQAGEITAYLVNAETPPDGSDTPPQRAAVLIFDHPPAATPTAP